MSYFDNDGDDRGFYEDYIDELGIRGDEYSQDMLAMGWSMGYDDETLLNMMDEYGISDPMEAREMFLWEMDMDQDDFDWEGWRDYMGYND